MPQIPKYTCANPEACAQEFQHIKEKMSTIEEKVNEVNAKLFENNGDSLSTRVTVMEKWVEAEMKTRSLLKTGLITLLTALGIQIALGVFNRIDILKTQDALISHDNLVTQKVVPKQDHE